MDSIGSFTIPASSAPELSSSSNINVTACWSFHVDGSPNCKPTSCIIGYDEVLRGEFTKDLCHCSTPCLSTKPETYLQLRFPRHRVVECNFSLLKSQFRFRIAVGRVALHNPRKICQIVVVGCTLPNLALRSSLRTGELLWANSDGQ